MIALQIMEILQLMCIWIVQYAILTVVGICSLVPTTATYQFSPESNICC
jgi:hypothetical protein